MKPPSDETLARYLLGTCNEEDAARVEKYLESDADGFVHLERVGADDALMDKLRDVMSADAASAETIATGPMVTRTSDGGVGMGASDVPSRREVRVAQSDASSWSVGVKANRSSAHIEGYELLDELGRGGMGVVHTAVQQSTKRKVALKVLLEGPFASTAAKRRFEREVELAARLDHPNIVTILESGIASGRYYFAMQYIEGVTLDKHFKHGRLPIDQRLRVFSRICHAVGYAHQRGIIHRDLKPSNILVDEKGEPHVLDFGLAKPADTYADDLEQSKALSLTGQLMGTLPYMSPEQAAGQNHLIDIRTDIYSLGVMLYESLTGQFPYQVVGHVADVLKSIQETSPKRPSTIQRRINNELETIVLKALAKEPERRYQSAEALAMDVEAFLIGGPIAAKRASSYYLASKLLRKHRRAVGVSALMLVVLTLSGIAVARSRAREARGAAERLVAQFVSSPASAVRAFASAGAGVQALVGEASERAVDSSAGPQRQMGAASALWVAPEAFWRSVDGGPLWENGEWLEVCGQRESVSDAVLKNVLKMAESGTPKQRYVAWCLWGALTERSQALGKKQFAIPTTRDDDPPGVAAARRWAVGVASGLGDIASNGIAIGNNDSDVFIDDVSGMRFARIPGAKSFRRGSPPEDIDRFEDETIVPTGVAIAPIHVAETEVTWDAWQQFLREAGSEVVVSPEQQSGMQLVMAGLSDAERKRAAAGYITAPAANAYCQWLTQRAEKTNQPRRYRLPTEDEWEYACRGASTQRFCYGTSASYARYFANCDGSEPRWHRVGEHMPNWYGLFDMHGGLWEWTSSEQREQGQVLRVYRGGAFYSPALRCRSAQRNYGAPQYADAYRGLRLVMEFVE